MERIEFRYRMIGNERVQYTEAEEVEADAMKLEFQQEQITQVEADRVANIWKLIEEQERLSIRAILENDTVWIATRKQNIVDLKSQLEAQGV